MEDMNLYVKMFKMEKLLKRVAVAFDEWHETPDYFISEDLLEALADVSKWKEETDLKLEKRSGDKQ